MKTQNFNYAPPPEEGLFRNRHDPIPRGTKLLGKYTVERQLGAGGMGIVVAARHDTLDELVAFKFLLPSAMANRPAFERFLREARASGRLKSDHVVRVQDVGELETGEPYMIMEYLDGDDLKSILRSRGQLPILEAVDYLAQACKGVAAAHAKNIVHRDLKPANLFLTTTADGAPRVKVFDFGIARIVDPNEKDLTNNDIVGSLAYMSPEQLLTSRTADWRTDIWSLGVTLCELLTTKRPFDGDGRNELLSNIFNADPLPLSTWRTDVPEALELVLRRCLHKDRNERYQSAHELALDACAAVGLPPPMRPPMSSVSFSDSYVLPEMQTVSEPTVVPAPPIVTPVKAEQTQGTADGLSITGQTPPSLRSNRVKLVAAATASMATSAAIVTLVLALHRGEDSSVAENASPVPAVSIAASVTPLVLPATSDSKQEANEPRTIEIEETESAKTAQPIATNKTLSTSKTIVLPAETATVGAPESKPTPIYKPPTPPMTATATSTRSKIPF